MRLEPAELPGVPLPAALVDDLGGTVAATPEWRGAGPGTLSYRTGAGHLLVAPDTASPGLDVLMDRLLGEIGAAAAALSGDAGLQASVLAAGLALVAGRPVDAAPVGTVADVVALTAAAARARTQDVALDVARPLPEVVVAAPATIALALVQLVVNACQHEGARRVVLRVGAGPTFAVEWRAEARPSAGVRTSRHALRRPRWGWGYVRMVADALGGVALPPGPAGEGTVGACLGLGSVRLGLPLACLRGEVVERATQAWDEEDAPPYSVAALAAEAAADPGRIAYRGALRARVRRDRTWVALAPESGSSRALDLLRGLHHERALWSAPEPHATRAPALATLLGVAMGEPWPGVPPSTWAEAMPEAAAALGVPAAAAAPAAGSISPPDPRAAVLLLAEAGGRLTCRGDEVWLTGGDPANPLLRALGAGPDGSLRVTS